MTNRIILVTKLRLALCCNLSNGTYVLPIGYNPGAPMNPVRIPTPCVGLCSTTYGDSVCKGCKRFAHEIVDWNRYDESQKATVIFRLAQLIDSVVARYILVIDSSRLEVALRENGFRFRVDQAPSWWAYDLMRQTKGRIADLSACGLRQIPEAKHLTAPELWETMNREFMEISEGHYERYFRQPLSFD